MIERILPTPEAVERIRQLGEGKILQFLDEVTLESARNLVDFLPDVRGFRPYSDAGIKQQKVALARRLASKNSGAERDFMALYVMWRSWAREQLGDPEAVVRLLDDLESVAQQNSHGDDSGEALRAGTLAFLNALKQLSLDNKCSREKVLRLMVFSPLNLDSEGHEIIDSYKTEADIERDKAISDLPARLRAEEEEIKSINERLGTLSVDVRAAVTKADLIERASEAHSQAFRLLSETVDRLSQALVAVEESSKRNAETLGRFEKRSDELASQIRSSAARQDEFDGHIKTTVQSIGQAIGELRSIVQPLHEKLSGVSPASTDALESVVQKVGVLDSKLFSLSQGPASEDVEMLRKRLDALESTKSVGAPTIGISESAGLRITALTAAPNTEVQPLTDTGKIVGALAESLQFIGLKKSAASLLAEEIAAAILTGQAITFKGALAHLVARKCAESVSTGNAWNISIPIGLTDGGSLSAALQSLSSKSTSAVPSIVVEGLNRSALDCTKDALLAYAADLGAGHKFPVFCFTSLVSGIASLPVEPEHLELGPVFDLDYLDWRLSVDTDAVVAIGSVAPDDIASFRAEFTKATADDLEEVLRVLRRFMPKRNPRIERAVSAGYVALKNIRQDQADTSPLQSLAYGWLVPLWVALGLSKDEADSELDGGNCDASTPDPRVTAMLNQESFGNEPNEGGE